MKNTTLMSRALKLAAQGRVFPNPRVGAVLVGSDGRIIAEAFHSHFGGAHAEAKVLEIARRKKAHLRGASLFISLEPCVDFPGKKTPGCASSIAASGISRVFCAMKDPNLRVSGKGIKVLESAGIRVEVGILARSARLLNRPHVTIKAAVTLDGKIASVSGDSKWITGEAARIKVREMRDECDAILVGRGTVQKDNPLLAGKKNEPLRIILDSKLTISPRAKVFRDTNALLITTERSPAKKRELFRRRGFRMKIFPKTIVLKQLLPWLKEEKISRLLVEGGAEVFASFLEAGLVDEMYWFVAPKIIGGQAAKSAVGGRGARFMKEAKQFSLRNVERIGEDILLTLFPAGKYE